MFVAVGDRTTEAHITTPQQTNGGAISGQTNGDKLECDIDTAVYKLYDLTPEEIQLVQEG